MEALLESTKLVLFILIAFPGLISMHIYRLMMPARAIEWSTALLEGLFYSVVNFAICLPLLVWMTYGHNPQGHPIWVAFGFFIVLLVGPILWPVFFVRMMRSPRLMKNLQLPYPTAWDAYFDKRLECFVLVHLKSGELLGGYFGAGSFASSFPNDGDIYVGAVYRIDESGCFGEPIPFSRGFLIRKDEYSYLEFFDIPPQQDQQNE